MTGRVVLITGAGGGIGAATARTIAAAGGQVVLHDVQPERVDSLAAELALGAPRAYERPAALT